jgi:vacuolar-type H+-ATPase subunit H
MLKYTEIEREILSAARNRNSGLIAKREAEIQEAKQKLDYQMERFIDQFGKELDDEGDSNYRRFYRVKCEEYSQLNRLLRVIKAVSK